MVVAEAVIVSSVSAMVLVLLVLDMMLLILVMTVGLVHAHLHEVTVIVAPVEHAMLSLRMALVVHNERLNPLHRHPAGLMQNNRYGVILVGMDPKRAWVGVRCCPPMCSFVVVSSGLVQVAL